MARVYMPQVTQQTESGMDEADNQSENIRILGFKYSGGQGLQILKGCSFIYD